ncbi:hypothetical protein [Streptomyces halobius]|uniref:MFS transporter n=1 Tax=Streptomyces halobius TaxID=2879846 RepID=A0ABY4MF62_9ACTN|nr:hypothetical protein [Streptomyces halobius]UQA96342.1 hypothetical protein K9S39_34695 [Streptomyces halobius]
MVKAGAQDGHGGVRGGLLITPITTVTSGISERDAGAASGLMNTTRQIGGAVGLAALVTVAATTAGTAASYRAVFVAIAVVCTAAFTLPAPHHREAADAPGK